MSKPFSNLNLKPQERRLLVVVGIVVFLVLNALLVWPHFGDWAKLQEEMTKSQKTLDAYETEVAKLNEYRAKLAKLEGEGSNVLPAEQAIHFIRTVQALAQSSGVTVNNMRAMTATKPTGASTNVFFEEQNLPIQITSGDKELVEFLQKLGKGNSSIRVKSMTLKPDPSQSKLSGDLTLTASYQK